MIEKTYTGWTFDQFQEDAVVITHGRTVTEADIINFAGISGDFNPLHMDAEYCKNTDHKKRICHGSLTFAISAGMFNRFVDGTCVAFLDLNFKYTKYVFPGDTLCVKFRVLEKKRTSKGDRGVVKFAIQTLNQNEEVVLEGIWTLLLYV